MENSFRLPVALEPAQEHFLLNGLSRSGLFASFNLHNQELQYQLHADSDRAAASTTWTRLVTLAQRHKVECVFMQKSERQLLGSVTEALINKGFAKRLGEGCYLFQGDFLKLINWFDQKIVAWAETLGAEEQQYPVLWPIDLFKKINYFRDFPQNILMVAGVKKDNASLQEFSARYRLDKDFAKIAWSDEMAPMTHALGTSTCDPCYYAFRDGALAGDRVYHARNKCFRNETSEHGEIDRLREFSMREVIAVGCEKHVLGVREEFFKFAREFIQELELSGRIETANDPFFTNDAALKKLFQDSLKGKYEIIAETGGATGDVAVGSINWHGDQFGRAFAAHLPNGDVMRSCCVGYGFERLAFAFCAQHGLEREQWPEPVYKAIFSGAAHA